MVCPFHEDDTPSMVVYPNPKNEFHCFGCGKHGDAINFYASVCGLDFKTALERLAYTYIGGYDPHKFKAFKVEPKKALYEKPKEQTPFQPYFSDIYEDLREHCLNYPTTESTRKAAEYLRNRGLDDWTIRHFKLFVIKNYNDANTYLKQKYSQKLLQEAGLVNDKGNLIFFVHPIIFPYYKNKRIVYLQGRTIGNPPENSSKYQFLKGLSRPIFNIDTLKNLRPYTKVYITEGAIDCMTLVKNGYASISLGSAKHFRKEWAEMFQQFRMVVWFDNDVAGQQGTLDLMEQLHLAGIEVQREYLPAEFKDINEYFNKKN